MRRQGEALVEVNNLLDAENEAAMFVTLFYAIYNPRNHKFTYANGGHNEPIIVHPDGSTTVIDPTGGTALGIIPGIDYDEDSVELQPGDTVILYTDGITEAFNSEGELFGMDRLREVFRDKQPVNAEETSAMVFDAVNEFAGDEPQSDDQACLVFKRT